MSTAPPSTVRPPGAPRWCPPPGTLRWDFAFRPLLVSAVLVPLSILAAGAGLAWQQVWVQAEAELVRSADAAAEYAARFLDAHALLADRADDLLRGLTDERIQAQEARWHDALRRVAAARPSVLSLDAIGADGRPLVGASRFPVPRSLDPRGREAFDALRDPAAPEPFVGTTRFSVPDDQHSFAVARRRGAASDAAAAPGQDGPFRGVVLVTLRTAELAARLRRLGDEPDDAVAMVRADGELLARSTGFSPPAPPAPAGAAVRGIMARGVERAVVRGASAFDGVGRIAAFRRVEGWPVYVSASRPQAAVVARWREIVAWQAGFGAPAAFASIALVLFASRRARETAEAHAALRVEVAGRAATRALRESEERYRALAEATREGVAIHDGARIVETNEAFWRMFGHRSREDVIGRAPLDFIAPAARQDALDKASGGHTDPYEGIGSRADGTTFPIEFHGYPVRFRGRPMRAGIVRDLTWQKAAEAASREGEAFLRSVLDAGTDRVEVVGLDGRLEFMNAQGRCLMELGDEAAIAGTEWIALWPEQARARSREAIAAARAGGADHFEAFCPTAKGTPKWWDVAVAPVRDGTGRVARVVCTSRDVTGRKRTEARLRESEATLNATLDALPVGVVIADVGGKIVRDNAAHRELWGAPPEAANWEQYGEWVGHRPDTGERIRAEEWAMTRALLRGEVVRGEAVECERFGTGERRFFLNNAAPVRDEAGRIVAAVVAELDVTEALRAQRALREGETRLRELQSELLHVARLSAAGEMASALAHELNQPLTAIASSVGGALRLLQPAGLQQTGASGPGGAGPPPRVLEAMTRAAAQALRAGQIVQRLREFVAAGETRTQAEDLTRLVREAGTLALVDAKGGGVAVGFRFAPGLPPVLVDRIQIQQVLINLMRNAIEAMSDRSERGGAVTRELVVAAVPAGSEAVEVSVADTGPGLAPEVAERLFRAFVTTKPTGMGIGLSICRSIVQAHGGRIWAEANPGGGTIFRFTLPVVPERDEADGSGQDG